MSSASGAGKAPVAASGPTRTSREEAPFPTAVMAGTSRSRNAPAFVDSLLPREGGVFLHFDGQFTTIEDLVRDSFTGRNFGWLPSEAGVAIAHFAHVLRDDDGTDLGGVMGGGRYGDVFRSDALPAQFHLDTKTATDRELYDGVARVIGAYIRSLVYRENARGELEGSPYDRFLEKNSLPRLPAPGESEQVYAKRLAGLLDGLTAPKFESDDDFTFAMHDQSFTFGPAELAGLKTFLGPANCAACHAPPRFSDYGFHNTGAAQDEYDSLHGAGSFAALHVPTLAERTADFDGTMEATPQHPYARGTFLDIPGKDRPGVTDLGLWNVFANPDFPAPQADLLKLLCRARRDAVKDANADCSPTALLPTTVARFRTLPLRDLGDSAPYLHTGRLDTIEDTLAFYVRYSKLARDGAVVNADPELGRVSLFAPDVATVAAFLRSLNEDYE